MIGYLVALILLLGAFGGYTWYQRNDAVTDYEARLAAKDQALKEFAEKIETEAANHITDMEAAYEAGEAQARVITKVITARGAADVAKYPVFANPACVLPDDSLLVLNSARTGLLPAADTSPPPTVVPGPAEAGERETRDPVSTNAGGRTEVSNLPAPTRPTSGSSAVPGPGMRTHPKPTPIR